MTTLRTRRGIVPIVASRRLDTVELAASLGVPAHWEVRIAPDLPMEDVPFVLRSTYVCPDLATAMVIAISTVDSYLEHETFTEEWDVFRTALTRTIRREVSVAEVPVGLPLPSDALYPM